MKFSPISLLVMALCWRAFGSCETISNDVLSVSFDCSNAAFSVRDERTGHVWRQLVSTNFPLKVMSVSTGEGSLVFSARCENFASELKGRVVLIGGELETTLDAKGKMDFWENDEIAWPYAFEGKRGERVLLPHGCGYEIPCEQVDLGTDKMDRMFFYNRDMNMRVWAQYAPGGPGYAAIVNTPVNATADFSVRTNGLRAMSVRWRHDMGEFGHARSVRYVFFRNCDAMTVALRYRVEAKRIGYYVTLEDKKRINAKIARTIDDMAGAPNVWFWEVAGRKADFARELKELGFGTFLFGFAARKDLGVWRTPQEVAEVSAVPGTIPVEYDIYCDTMASKHLPEIEYVRPYWSTAAADNDDICYSPDGNPIRGWKVALKGERDGGARSIRCAWICDSKAAHYARRRLSEEKLKYPQYRARFLDVTGGDLGECWKKEHYVSRRDSEKLRRELFGVVQNELDLVCGTEDGLECYVPTATYFEGMMSAPNHYRVDGGRFMSRIYDEVPDPIRRGTDETLRVPFFEMVYHGCVISYWYWCDYNNKFPRIWWKRDLFNIVTGTPPMYFFTRESFALQKGQLSASFRRATQVARATAFSPMRAYRFLSDDRRVQQSEFENGVIATVNFGDLPYQMSDGYVLEPRGSRVQGIVQEQGQGECTSFLPSEGWCVSAGKWEGKTDIRQCERMGDRTRVRYDGTRTSKERRWITLHLDCAKGRMVAKEGDVLAFEYELSNPTDFVGAPCLRVADSKGKVFAFEPSKKRRLSDSRVACEFALDARRQLLFGSKASDGMSGDLTPVSISFVFTRLTEQSGFIDFVSLSRMRDRSSSARNVLVRETVYQFGIDTALEHTYPAGPRPVPAAETYILNADVGRSPGGKVVLTLADRDTGRVVRLTSRLGAEMRFQADLPFGSFWVPRHVEFVPDVKSDVVCPVWKSLSIERKETQAESLRFVFETGHPVRLIRDGVLGERPAAVFRNPTSEDRRWNVRLVFSDFHGESFSIITSVCAKAGEKVQMPIDSGRFGMGHYRVRAEIEGEDGSTDVKESMFAKIPLITRTPKIPFGTFRFGFNYHLGNYDEEERRLTMEAVVAAGAKIVRMTGPHFARIQPAGPDKWVWGETDRQIGMLNEAGLAVDAIIYQTPKWALAHPEKTNEPWKVWSYSMPRLDVFARFCSELSERYGDKIDYYEVGNEFDLRPTNVFTVSEAVEIQKTAYAALKRGNKGVRVITNGWASDTDKPSMFKQKGVHEAVMRGAKGFYDVHPIHLHGWYDKYIGGIHNFFKMRERIGIANVPWYANETAMTGVHGMENEVAETVWKKILWSWAHGSTDYIWYNLRATGWKPDDSEQNFGVITADYFPRPSYAAFAALSFACQGLDFDGILRGDACRQVYRFKGRRDGRDVCVITAWDTASTKMRQSVRFETDASRATIMDLMGNVRETAVEGGSVTYTFGAEPSLMTLWGASRAEPDEKDIVRSLTDREVRKIQPGPPMSRLPDFVLDSKRHVIDAYEANPETVSRTWKGPSDLSARVWLSRHGDAIDAVVETVDDVYVPTAADKGDRVSVVLRDESGTELTKEAAVVSQNDKVTTWRASVVGVQGDVFGFNVVIDDDDGPGRDVMLTMPKSVSVRFGEGAK